LLKKVTGEVIFVPLTNAGFESYHPEELLILARGLNVRARISPSLEQALTIAREQVDPREGLVVITGASSLVTEYWRIRDVKKI